MKIIDEFRMCILSVILTILHIVTFMCKLFNKILVGAKVNKYETRKKQKG